MNKPYEINEGLFIFFFKKVEKKTRNKWDKSDHKPIPRENLVLNLDLFPIYIKKRRRKEVEYEVQ